MMIISWDKDDVLLTEYLPGGTTINGPSDSSIIEGLRSVILEKRHDKISHGVLLVHDSAPINKCNIVQAGFIKLNYCAYSSDIAPADFHPSSSLKQFLHSKNFSSDDEAIATVRQLFD